VGYCFAWINAHIIYGVTAQIEYFVGVFCIRVKCTDAYINSLCTRFHSSICLV